MIAAGSSAAGMNGLTVGGLTVEKLTIAGPAGVTLLGPLDLELNPGECVGLIGESGSGKSLTALALMGLLPPGLHARGRLRVAGTEVELQSARHRSLRGRRIAWMPQDSQASLHPLRTVGTQLAESLRAAGGFDAGGARAEVARLFSQLDLPAAADWMHRYPHQLSGGQRQRVGLALALAGKPDWLLADEPTSALDPRLAEEILALLDRLRRERNLGILLISHDLPLIGRYASRLVILQRGRSVETGDTADIFARPRHDYTRALLAADKLPAAQHSAGGKTLLSVVDLQASYPRNRQPAVAGASFDLQAGHCLALVGASGSGKSSVARAVLRLFRSGAQGRVWFDGEDMLSAAPGLLRRLRRKVGVVFQDPYASLDPRLTIGEIVAEPLRIAGELDRAQRRDAAIAVLGEVGLPADVLDRYPHQFSGGQRQRIAIARALICRPLLLICDEAVSALDAQHRAEVLALLGRLKRERGLALLFITHDFGAARTLADRIAVMEAGRLVEQGSAGQIFAEPAHPATQAMLAIGRRKPTATSP